MNSIISNANMPLIKCTYLIKEKKDIQIINYKGKNAQNEEIKKKVKKIW